MAQSHFTTPALVFALIAAGATAACSSGGADKTRSVRQGLFEEQPGPFPREGECNIADPMFDDIRARLGGDHNTGPATLKGEPIPEPSTLSQYIRNRKVATQMGKAL